VLSARSARLAASTTFAAGGLYLVIGLIPVTIGLGATTLLAGGFDHEQVLAEFAKDKLPLPLYILFLGALVSAILSTLSGALLVAASLAAHNVYVPLRPQTTEAQKLRANRIAVVLFGIAAFFIALSSESVYELVQEAGGLGSSGILVAMLFALWWPRLGGAASGYGALIAGTAVYIGAKHGMGYEQPYLMSLAAALAVYLLLALVSRPGASATGGASLPMPTASG
jgi:Na+/proline symporter